jgi:3-oxoacyl-[acyl-carrier protein] reductase
MDFGLKEKRAFVSGGSSGIGYAIAQALADEGARVTIAGREEKKLSEAVAKLSAGGRRVDAVQLDLTDEASTRRGFEKALSTGPVDILINNTGGPGAGPILDIPLSDWDKGYAALVRSVLVSSQLVVPGMRDRRWGRILTITSTSAREIIPRLPVSSTFRAGLTALTKELAKELGRSGILVNNLLPGPIRTARLQELAVKSPQFYHSMETHSALGRVGEPEELGRIAAFLCSAANSYITGTDVLADGGYTSAL